jgi:hypothetical protein
MTASEPFADTGHLHRQISLTGVTLIQNLVFSAQMKQNPQIIAPRVSGV